MAWLFDADTGAELVALTAHENWGERAAFSHDGARLLTAARTVRLVDATTGAELMVLRGHDGRVWSALFCSGGRRILTTSTDRTARLWDAATGTELVRIVLDADVTAAAVHDGCIALGDALGRVHVFDADEFLWAGEPV